MDDRLALRYSTHQLMCYDELFGLNQRASPSLIAPEEVSCRTADTTRSREWWGGSMPMLTISYRSYFLGSAIFCSFQQRTLFCQ
mmetsp:Transcript_8809/g.18420  ORF Transcript_8809/g.18420 Transcript_8809/m.18420 type:complete len:84 (+) Transcript_8809:1315-1566(+)